MINLSLFILLVLMPISSSYLENNFPNLKKNLECRTPVTVQKRELVKLLQRAVGSRFNEFEVNILEEEENYSNTSQDQVRVYHNGSGKVEITGTNAVSIAFGFNHYLKYYCRVSLATWSTKSSNLLPTTLPLVDKAIRFQDFVRYYQNVCEYGYTFVWWEFDKWEAHIDWMALNGRNLVLAQSGQEFIALKLYQKLGISQKEVLSYFTGPAFLPWNRMGNLKKWGGPLPISWIEQDRRLQHKILERMRNLCIHPVIPAFNGIVPDQVVTKIFTNTSYTKMRKWGHFDENYSGLILLDMTSEEAKSIGSTYLQLYEDEYGHGNFYNLDTFNEMSPPHNSIDFLKSYSRSTFKVLNQFNSDAIWVLQGWMFRNTTFWTSRNAKSFLRSVPLGRLLVLDEASNTSPEYQRLNSYFGQPFVFCLLENYGGTIGMYGKLSPLATRPYQARNNYKSMVGSGLTPEGLQNNYVAYDLMLEASWRSEPVDLSHWIMSYAKRRTNPYYSAGLQEGWNILMSSVFNCTSDLRYHGKTLLTELPSIHMKQKTWYKKEDLLLSWDLFVKNTKAIESDLSCDHPLVFDSVDITRQVLVDSLYDYYVVTRNAFHKGNIKVLERTAKTFLDILRDLDQLLSSCDHFLLGNWLSQIVHHSKYEELLFNFNARNQITLWGPNGNVLDYAAKQWSGLITDYYLPRWQLFFDELKQSLKKDLPFREDEYKTLFLRLIAMPFNLSEKKYSNVTNGSAMKSVRRVYGKWRNKI